MRERTRQVDSSSVTARGGPGDAAPWVEVEFTVMEAEHRIVTAADTAQLPLVGRVRGFAIGPVEVGADAEVETLTGRRQRGTVIDTEPGHRHSFGRTDVSVLLNVWRAVRGLAR